MKNCRNHGFTQIDGLRGGKSVKSKKHVTHTINGYPETLDVLDFNSIEFDGISLDTKVVEFDHFELLTIDKKEEQKISDICAILQIRDADKKEKHLIISNKSVILTT